MVIIKIDYCMIDISIVTQEKSLSNLLLVATTSSLTIRFPYDRAAFPSNANPPRRAAQSCFERRRDTDDAKCFNYRRPRTSRMRTVVRERNIRRIFHPRGRKKRKGGRSRESSPVILEGMKMELSAIISVGKG